MRTEQDFLGDKPWFLGARASSLDAAAFGLLVNILWCPMESPLKQHLRSLSNLCAFCDRVRHDYFGASSSVPITGHLAGTAH